MANGAYTFNYLNNMINCKFKFIRANGKSIAIQHKRANTSNNYYRGK